MIQKKTFHLDTKLATDSFFEDTQMIGIVAPMDDYHFIWHVNNMFQFQFRAVPEATIQLHKKKVIQKKEKEMDFFFSVFEYNIPAYYLSHIIYHNQNKGEPLLPKYKNVDFLWLMKGDFESNEDCNAIIPALREIPGVQLVMNININDDPTREHLVL